MGSKLALEVASLRKGLRSYQREGVSFLFRNSAALLADEMGLGKTVQAIAALRLLLRKPGIERAIIVAPASLVLNWERELERWGPELVVRRLAGSAADRFAYYLLPIAVLIATYEQVSVDALDRVPDGTFDIVILDEAQRIKNYSSRTAFACRLLPRDIAWALTGTPIENSRSDILSIFAFLRPGLMPSSKPGKFEILTGQRRFLAHRMLQKKTIVAIVRTDPIDENLAKGISVTENVMRLDLTTKELIDACTSMYKKYGTIKDVCETTGLPKDKVGLYVKYDRLVPQLRQLVDNGEVKLDTALRAQDAASVSGTTKEEEAVTFAKAMEPMSGVQRSKIVKDRKLDPDLPVDDVIESAKTGKVRQVIVTLSPTLLASLRRFAAQEGQTQDDAAGSLVEEGLQQKGF